jgi:Yip1 domain
VTLVTGGVQMALLSSEKGQEALLSAFQQQIRQTEAQGTTVSPEQRQNMERLASVMGYVSAGAGVVLGPAVLALLALIIGWLFNAVLGGEVSFRHVYAVVVHSGVVSTFGSLLTTPLMYFKGEMVSPTQLSVFLPMLADDSFATYLLKALDLIILWWLISLAIGLAVLYKRRTGPVATTLIAVYVGIALLIATVRSSFG